MSDYPFIPYFETTRYRVEAMIELVNPQPGEKMADLGSGDGRISIAFGEKGCVVDGFELDSELKLKSEERITTKHLENRVRVHQKDFWDTNLGAYDIITIYPMPDIMEALEKKLQKEVYIGARILTNYYPLPTWKEKTTKDYIHLYIK